MCGSDLHAYRKATGKSDKIIGGHEPSGVIAALGPGVAGGAARVGARVMVHHYHGCTTCEHCRSGWAQLCTNGETEIYGVNRNGAHARYMLVPADTLVPLDDRLSFAVGAAISCGTGTAWGALKRMGLSGRDTIAIFGQGPVGLSATQLAAAQGARVIALDVEPARLARSKAFGAAATINPSERPRQRSDLGADARKRRGQIARDVRLLGSGKGRLARSQNLGNGDVRRPRRGGRVRRTGVSRQADHDHDVVEHVDNGPEGLRRFHNRARNRYRFAVHRQLSAR